jgi:hypothetical protein
MSSVAALLEGCMLCIEVVDTPLITAAQFAHFFCACSGQPVGASDMSSVAALLEGCVLCNDSHLHQETLQDGRQVWVPNGAPTEVCMSEISGSHCRMSSGSGVSSCIK